MKFGLFYEIQVPRPWTDRSDYDAYQQVLAQVEYAEQMGSKPSSPLSTTSLTSIHIARRPRCSMAQSHSAPGRCVSGTE
jgi:hypothetical protein